MSLRQGGGRWSIGALASSNQQGDHLPPSEDGVVNFPTIALGSGENLHAAVGAILCTLAVVLVRGNPPPREGGYAKLSIAVTWAPDELATDPVDCWKSAGERVRTNCFLAIKPSVDHELRCSDWVEAVRDVLTRKGPTPD